MKKSKNEVSILKGVPLIDWYNKFVVPSGNKYRVMTEKGVGVCPFHDDHDPSLKVWGSKNVFHCFGCGFTGDVIITHMRFKKLYHGEKLTKEEAIKQLASIWGIQLIEEDIISDKSIFKEGIEYIQKDIPSVFNDLNIYSYSIFNTKIGKVNDINKRIKMYQDLDIRIVSKIGG